MKISYLVLIATFIACIAGGLIWSADHYHGKFLKEQQRADSTEIITANVLRTVTIMNQIVEAKPERTGVTESPGRYQSGCCG